MLIRERKKERDDGYPTRGRYIGSGLRWVSAGLLDWFGAWLFEIRVQVCSSEYIGGLYMCAIGISCFHKKRKLWIEQL